MRYAATEVLAGAADAIRSSDDTPPSRAGSALAKASDAEVATASTTVPERHVATPKKAKKTASRRAPRRDPYWYGAPSWREVEYQRGAYGRGGFTPNFW
jgi:hypothetical protein